MNQSFGSSGRYPGRDYGSMNSSDFAGFSPTEFFSLKENIASNIVYIKSSWHQLERSIKSIGTSKDNQEQRNLIHEIQMNTNQKVTETSKDLKRLSTLTRGGDRQQKLEVDRIKNEFTDIVDKYCKSQKIVAGKMKQVLLVNSAALVDVDETFDEHRDRQLSMQRHAEMQFETEMLQEREQKIQQIEADVLDVNIIFRDLNSMINDQGQAIDTIASGIETGLSHVEQGREELEKTVQYQAKYRKKVCFLIVLAIILGLILTAIIVSSIKS